MTGSGMHRTLRNAVLNGAVFLVSLVLGLALLEGAGRWVLAARNAPDLDRYQAIAGGLERTHNVYFFGASTMQGEPYDPGVSIPRLVAELLPERIDGRAVRTINLGTAGFNIAQVLELTRQVVRDSARTHPAALVVYAGHNEFLRFHERFRDGLRDDNSFTAQLIRHSRVAQKIFEIILPFRLEIDDRRMFDRPIVDAEQRRAVLDAYRVAVEELVGLARSVEAPLVLSTIAGNAAGWAPNRSTGCPDGRREAVRRALDAAGGHELTGRVVDAEEAYGEAIAACPSFAEAYFRLGRLYAAQGRREDARAAFVRAVDLDGMPIRALSDQNAFLRGLHAPEREVYVVDAARQLDTRSAVGATGYDWMIDGHHPNLAGYLAVSELLAARLSELFGVPDSSRRSLTLPEVERRFGIDDSVRTSVLVSRGRWHTRLSTWRYDPTTRLDTADAFFARAARLDPGRHEAPLGQAMVRYLRRDEAAADSFLTRARRLDSEAVEAYLGVPWVRAVVDRARASVSGF